MSFSRYGRSMSITSFTGVIGASESLEAGRGWVEEGRLVIMPDGHSLLDQRLGWPILGHDMRRQFVQEFKLSLRQLHPAHFVSPSLGWIWPETGCLSNSRAAVRVARMSSKNPV